MKRIGPNRRTWMSICLTWLACGAAAENLASAVGAVTLDIKSQPVADALHDFAQQSGVQVLFYSDVADRELKVTALSGTFTPDSALTQLLANTGLSWSYVNANTVAIRRAEASSLGHKATHWDGEIPITRMADLQAAGSEATAPERTGGPENGEGSVQNSNLEEIVVTAQKREERLKDVPQSVTALSADELTRVLALQFRDYADTVPGLAYNTTGAGYTQIVLRGVTTGYETGATVAMYVDEVPYGGVSPGANSPRQTLDAGLFDLDRVEVLRGPQGTLYGASAVGGLVKYVSKRPSTDQFEGQAQLGIASTEQGGLTRSLAGAANLPISEGKAGVRVSGFYNHDGGYIDNVALGQHDVNQAEIYGGRADLLLTPTEKFSVRLAAHAQNISRDGESSADFTFAGSPMDSNMTQRRLVAEPFDQKFRLASATLSYHFDGAELTSISSYQEVDSQFVLDLTDLYRPFYGPLNSYGAPYITDTDKFAQEIRLASASGERFEWVVGGFYTDEDTYYRSSLEVHDAGGQLVIANPFLNPNKLEEYAGFGTLTWHLTKKFDVSGGIRYSKIHQSFQSTFSGVVQPGGTENADATTYLANARYRFNDQSMLYARYATGYRPGGPNGAYFDYSTNQYVPIGPYDSDTLSSYEMGFRHETADHRFSVDMAAYYIDWKDIIIVLFDPVTFASYKDNAAGMEVRGGELALTARPVRSLTLAAVMAYTDAYMAEANIDLGSVKGERMPTSPRFNGSLTANYAFSGFRWQPTLGAAFRYTGDRKASFDQNLGFPQYLMDAYTAVDLRAGLNFSPYDVQLYVRNLLDERGQVSAYTWQGNPRVAIQQPRTIGFTVTTRF